MPFALVTDGPRADARQGRHRGVHRPDRHPPRRRDRQGGLGRGEPQEPRTIPAAIRPAGCDGSAPIGWNFSVVEPALDLDGDGTRDVLVVVGTNHAFLALSGKDGSMLWNHVAELDGPGGPQPEGPELPGPIRPASRPGAI